MTEVQTLVIDNGSSIMKAGFAGDEMPRSVFPSFIGSIRSDITNYGTENTFIGIEALVKACICSLKYPIEHGIVTNWDDMEKIYHHIFNNELRVDPAEHPVLLTDAPNNPRSNREKMIEIMFETFNVPSFYVALQGDLSHYSVGLTTCIVCEIGDGVTQVVPCYEGSPNPRAFMRNNFGGHDLIEWLQTNLEPRGYYFRTSEEKEIIRDMMEKNCYVVLDYDSELVKAKTSNECDAVYTLPDGNTITLSDERFRCPEILFKPNLNGFELDGIDKIIFDSIMKCKNEEHKDLLNNIVLTGGCSMFDGFTERVEKEILKRVPQSTKIKIISPSNGKFSAWIGGSIFASLPTFSKKVISHDEYNEAGPGIVHRRCFF